MSRGPIASQPQILLASEINNAGLEDPDFWWLSATWVSNEVAASRPSSWHGLRMNGALVQAFLEQLQARQPCPVQDLRAHLQVSEDPSNRNRAITELSTQGFGRFPAPCWPQMLSQIDCKALRSRSVCKYGATQSCAAQCKRVHMYL